MQHKEIVVPFEIKALSETGEFSGEASVYGVRDLGNDVVDAGAFTKTIAERGNKVRLLDGHKVRIGIADVTEGHTALLMGASINLEKQAGRDAYSDLKFYRDQGLPMGLSIGYDTVKFIPPAKSADGARHLTEVRLWEVSITEFPMNEAALVTGVKQRLKETQVNAGETLLALIESVKAARAAEQKDDFTTELQEIQLYSARYQMMQALSYSLNSMIYDAEVTDKVAASQTSIEQFSAMYLAMLPDYLTLVSTQGMGWMSRPGFEQKAGRVLSQANRDLVTKCITDLQALLAAADAAEGAAKNTGTPGEPVAATKDSIEPDEIHSALASFKSQISGVSALWN